MKSFYQRKISFTPLFLAILFWLVLPLVLTFFALPAGSIPSEHIKSSHATHAAPSAHDPVPATEHGDVACILVCLLEKKYASLENYQLIAPDIFQQPAMRDFSQLIIFSGATLAVLFFFFWFALHYLRRIQKFFPVPLTYIFSRGILGSPRSAL